MIDDDGSHSVQATSTLLKVDGLKTYFETANGWIKAVDGVDLALRRGESLAVVVESGCGKTVLALSLMRLVPSPPGKTVSGKIVFAGHDLLRVDEKRMQSLRGNRLSMIFQEPMTSLNPVFRVDEQVAEVLRRHLGISRREALERTAELFRRVGIPEPKRRGRSYPHQLSGGLRQRVMIAMAVACRPDLILADEPTTALDVTLQDQILTLLDGLKQELGTSLILISHDLGIVAQMADRVMVMYAGRVVEQAPVDVLFEKPAHPYTRGLLASIPRLTSARSEPLPVIPGQVPNLHDLPRGCSFQDRCPEVMEICRREEPPLVELTEAASVRCLKFG